MDTFSTNSTRGEVILNSPQKREKGSRGWCFTLNNWTEEEFHTIKSFCGKGKWIIGKEVGEEETPHLQGYVEFKDAVSFVKMKKVIPRAHLEKRIGTKKQAEDYCKKEGNFETNIPLPRKERFLKARYSNVIWRPWQQEILDRISTPIGLNRDIHWYWETEGNFGKSYLASYIIATKKAICVSGKLEDIMYQVVEWQEENPDDDLEVAIVDIPRRSADYVNYTAIEKLQDGAGRCGKYKGGNVWCLPMHILVFSNQEPDYNAMSADRWNVHELRH